MLKDLIYSSVGAALLTKEKFEEEIEGFHEKNSKNRERAKELYEQLQQKGQQEEQRFKAELKGMIKEVIEEMGIATKDDLKNVKK